MNCLKKKKMLKSKQNNQQRKSNLTAKLRAANAKITKAQREAIWQNVSGLFLKDTFYKIIRGSYISSNNIVYATAILEKMKAFIVDNKARIKGVSGKLKKSPRALK